MSTQRIAAAIARSGYCSRRQAEAWIEQGRVSVNGNLLSSPAYNIQPDDQIFIDGKPMRQRVPARLWCYHKPPGLLTTHHDPQGRPTIFDVLPGKMGRVISVGRLDMNSEGLLLLTNDGVLARRLEHPGKSAKQALPRIYRVRVYGGLQPGMEEKIAQGVVVEGVSYRPAQIDIEDSAGRNHWLYIKIYEGKNREIRKIFSHFGLAVNRLIRVAYGPFQLGDLPRGQHYELPQSDFQRFLPAAKRPAAKSVG